MNFLQPSILYALPLIGIPLLIHLINRRRYRTVHWAATMFLLQAQRMAKGMARLRYWLIMLARMLAIAGLIVAIARPMTAGWLGMTTGGAPELTVVVLDRSASMEQRDPTTGISFRESSLNKLTSLLQRFDADTRVVLFDSATGTHHEIGAADDLNTLPFASGTQTAADLPQLMESVAEYLSVNEAGRTDIWICSDMRQSDWLPNDGRWSTIRSQLQRNRGVRLYVLESDPLATDNLTVAISNVHRRTTADGAEVVMDIRVTRHATSLDTITVPVAVTIDGATSLVELELIGQDVVRSGHAVPVASDARQGWGRVALPGDSNPADDEWHFVYAASADQRTTIVAEDRAVAEILSITAESSTTREVNTETTMLAHDAAADLSLNATALLLWQGPLPTGRTAQQVSDFLQAGRAVIFFPPATPQSQSFLDASWDTWQVPAAREFFPIARWKTDSDLLANTQDGTPLPVGQLKIGRCCPLNHPRAIVLASLQSGPPLLSRVSTDSGYLWFCGTSLKPADSNLVDNGVSLYVMVQRALAAGAASLTAARQTDCGSITQDATREWTPVSTGSKTIPPSQRHLLAGVYRRGDRLIALNRPLSEDDTTGLTDRQLQQTLADLDFVQVRNETENSDTLAREVWRTFLVLMIAALLLEAVLSIPDRGDTPGGNVASLSTTAAGP